MAIPGNLYISIDFGSSPTKDDGTRPYTGANPHWNNFSIWLDGGPNLTETRVGTPTTVKVRVSNRGEAPVTNVRVDAYVMNPFVGKAQPQQAIRRLSGSVGSIGTGSGSTSATDAHVVTCNIQDPVQGPIPWTPLDKELDKELGNGHLCVIANVFADDDGHQLLEGEEFKVADDQHQGQRNIMLLAKMMLMRMEAGFFVMPALGKKTETRVAIETVDPKIAIGAGERWLLLSHAGISEEGENGELVLHHEGERFPLFLSTAKLRVRLTVDDKEPEPRSRFHLGRLLHPGRLLRCCRRRGGWLPPFEEPRRARIQIDTPEEDTPGAVHIFDIVQRDREEQVLGALRMLMFVNG